MATTEFLTGKFKIIVKANARENKIVGFDTDKNSLRIEIKARAEKNKANVEIIKFLTKQLGKRMKIVSGFTSKEKICEFS